VPDWSYGSHDIRASLREGSRIRLDRLDEGVVVHCRAGERLVEVLLINVPPRQHRVHRALVDEACPAPPPVPAEGVLRVRPEQVSVGKLNNVREAIAVARECRTIPGGNGISLEYSPLRHANNLESVLTYEGTNEIHTLVVGQALTGQAAYR
jgi:hypothetical protein